jgi:hypothetical protein
MCRHEQLVRGFAEACRRADLPAVRGALTAGAVAVCDGGGVVPGPLAPVHGADGVAELVAGLLCGPGELTVQAVNGRPGLALRRSGRAVAVVAVTVADAGIDLLWIVLNPAKLHGWHAR